MGLLASGILWSLPLQSDNRRKTPMYLVGDAPLEQGATMAYLIDLLNRLGK